MRQEIAVGAAVAAIAIGIAGAGCSSEKTPSATSSTATTTQSSATSATETANGSPPPAQAEVTVDGAKQNIAGNAVCTNAVGNFNIAIGQGVSGVVVVLSADAGTVHSVGLGNISGTILGFQQGISGGQAKVTKDGNAYTISGTATGITAALPPVVVSKPFEIRVTCP
ncbi:MAG: lipoprotein LpqH [Mycobacterium sp.]